MAGYNRISPNPFVDGAIIEATDFDTEFGALDTAFGTSGHTHDGTDGNGPKIDTAGLALNAVDSTILDETDSSYAVAGMTINSLTITSGTAVTSIDTDLSSVSASHDTLASAKAIKAYVDAQVDTADQLTELTDVTVTSVADNEVLAYDNASSKWINQTAIEAGLQPNDAGLTSIAGLSTSANQMIYTTASDTYATTSLTDAGRAILDDADASAQRTTLGLAIGTNVQAYDAGLNSIAGLTTAADKMIYTTGSDTYSTTGLSSFGRSLIDDADASAARTTLGLGTAATTASTDYATSAQGTLADSAVQPSDNISTLTNDSGYITGYTVTESDVTAHQTALSITESQISDLGTYLTGNQTITLSGDATGSGTTAITVALANNTVGVDELNLTDGTAGQFLKTDGAGNISFATAPTQSTSFTVLDVDNINLNGNTISSTDSEGAVIIQPSSGGDVTLDVTSNASYTEESPVLQGHVLVDSTMNLGLNSYQSPTTFYRRTYDTRPSGNQFVPSGQLVFQTYNGGRSATTMDSATIEAQQYYSASGNDYGTLTISTNYFNGISETKLTQVEFRSEGSSNATKREAAFLGKVIVGGETTTGLQVNNGNIKVASGHGIDFSSATNATGMSSELLDDYEEGTWTPTLTTTGTDFASVSHNASRSGTYTKIGRQVTVHCFLAWNNITVGSASGNLAVGGLPFTKGTSAAQIGPAYGYLFVNSPFNNPTQAHVLNGDTKASLYNIYGSDEFGGDSIPPNSIDTSATMKYLQMSVTYEV